VDRLVPSLRVAIQHILKRVDMSVQPKLTLLQRRQLRELITKERTLVDTVISPALEEAEMNLDEDTEKYHLMMQKLDQLRTEYSLEEGTGPMSGLPGDIIVKIIEVVVAPTRSLALARSAQTEAVKYSNVCKHWRQHTLSCRFLWTDIFLSAREASLAQAMTYLIRSIPHKVAITFMVPELVATEDLDAHIELSRLICRHESKTFPFLLRPLCFQAFAFRSLESLPLFYNPFH
jgi:hypothetical protein